METGIVKPMNTHKGVLAFGLGLALPGGGISQWE